MSAERWLQALSNATKISALYRMDYINIEQSVILRYQSTAADHSEVQIQLMPKVQYLALVYATPRSHEVHKFKSIQWCNNYLIVPRSQGYL